MAEGEAHAGNDHSRTRHRADSPAADPLAAVSPAADSRAAEASVLDRLPTVHALTDEVVAAAGRGDPDAFTVIWRELSPAVSGYLGLRGVRDPEAVTSDVFLAILPRLADLRGGSAGLRTFVFSVAHARAVDETRRRARRPEAVEFDLQRHDSVDESAEATALRRLASRELRALLDSLPADHRDVLALRVIADLSLEQAASVMGRSVGAIKQLQRRALLSLRAAVDADTARRSM